MSEQTPRVEWQGGNTGPDTAVLFGRILGTLIVVIALAVGIKVADSVRVDEFWAFLSTIMEPMGIGFLILVASEILNRMGRRHKGGA